MRQRWWLPVLALVLATSWEPTSTLPVPEEELDTSTKLLGSSVVTSVSVVTGSSEYPAGNADRSRVIPSKELPGSPADLLRPDRFQFYTLNKDGDVVTKQMTEQEIQSLIAAGGGHLPMEIHEPQSAGEVPNGGMKVSDVVQNVQNVLKGELSKPATVMTSMPTIPGHANTEWSSILPAILGGESEGVGAGDSDSGTLTEMGDGSVVADTTLIKIPEGAPSLGTKLPVGETSGTTPGYETKKKPTGNAESSPDTEKPMIQVPVITVDQKLPVHQDEKGEDEKGEEDSTPVFQMLNTISADKIDAKNGTEAEDKPEAVKPVKADEPEREEIGKKPEKVTIGTIIAEDQSSNADVPEMVEINLSPNKPTEKPDSMTMKVDVVSKVPQPESSATVSVISETHSTSMKISGQEEIPLRQPSTPLAKPVADPVALENTEEEKPELTAKPSTNPPTYVKLDSTTMKPEPPVTPAKVSATETTEKPGLIAQGVSFFGHLPQAVSSIVSDFMASNSPSSRPTVEEADAKIPPKTPENIEGSQITKDSTKQPQTTETSSRPTTSVPTQETAATKKPDEEPIYQKIPEIIPNKKIRPQAASPAEASSIEHIIETLNDPTGSLSGTVAAEHYGAQDDPKKSTTLAQTQTSTAATPINVETPAEPSSSKPMEPLPTELADSLSSMISQISDAMPSVLPISQNAGLDTTEKKNVIDMQAEEPGTNETTKTGAEEVPKVSEEPAKKPDLPAQDELEKPAVVSTTAPEVQDSTTVTMSESETTEKFTGSSSSIDSPVTTESVNLDSSITVKTDASLALEKETEAPVNKVEKVDSPEGDKLEASPAIPQKLAPEADPVLASSEIATDKVTLADSTETSVVITDATQSAITDAEPVEKLSTEIPATIATSSVASDSSTIPSDGSEAPPKVETIAPVELKSESQENDASTTIGTNENNTEMPIVHIDITGTKPTDVDSMNKSQGLENEDNGTESPLVRIQLTDPVALVNNMIKSAGVNASAGPIVPLTLPKTGSVPANSIASGLIAGFPTSETLATSETSPTDESIDSAESQSEIQPVQDASANGTVGDLKGSNVQENITKTVTPEETPAEVAVESIATERIEVLETSTLKDALAAQPDVTAQATNSPVEPVADDKTVKETTVQADVVQQTTTDKPRKEESTEEAAANKNAEAETTSTPVAAETTSNDQNFTKSSENVSVVLEEATTQVNTAASAEVTEDGTKTSVPASVPAKPAVPEQSESDSKVNEASGVTESSVSSSAKPEVTAEQADSSGIKMEDPILATQEKSENATNSTLSEVPIVRIDVSPEAVLAEMPSKIQLTDLPIVETTAAPIRPIEEEKVQTQSFESVTTTQTPVEKTADEDDKVETSTVNITEKTVMEIEEDKLKPEEAVKQPGKMESGAGSDSLEKIAEASTTVSAPQQTEEVRIQVNDTAVLVTKRPVSEISGQTVADVQKTTVNQPTEEQSTTPKVAPVTEGPVAMSAEKVERLPVPVKVSELSSSKDAPAADALIKTDTGSSSGSENRIRLGDEQGNAESTTVKVDDSRKPVKKNSDSDSSQASEGEDDQVASTSKIPAAINDDVSALRDKDSNVQPSIKVEQTTIKTFDKTATTPKISPSIDEDKPAKQSDKKPPVRVVDRPGSKPGKPAHKPTMNIKKDDAAAGSAEEKWTLIPQQVYPALSKTGSHTKRPSSTEVTSTNLDQAEEKVGSSQRPPVSLDHPQSASGLDSTVKNLETDISYFANLCNELAFTFWTATNKGLSTSRSLAVSPFGMTSMLAMVFLGARGPTSDQMNDILKLDDVASFNPHLVFQNVTDAVGLARNQGIANAAFVRELFADRSKVRKLMPFYKEQAQQFYDGVVAEVNFATISDLVRRRTNLMIRKQTGGRIKDFVRTNTVPLRSPLAAMSANVFQTDCNSSAASSEGRDGELYFAVSPAVRQRKLVPVPATVWRAGVLAGYEPSLDATAIALGGVDKLVSTIFVIPGQQGHTAPGDTLDHLEQRFVRGATHDGAWNKLLKVLIPRPGLELQVPKFSHRSVINATAALKRMGLEELFSKHADLKGINGIATDLHLADVLQMNLFSTCGDENILSGRHHVEVYPGSPLRNAREHRELEEEKEEFFNDLAEDEKTFSDSVNPYEGSPHREARSARQTEGTEKPRLKLDRPFLYFVRHNPTGLILHMGRFNPRLLP